MVPVVLSIGALDASGADGLGADLRSFAALGVHGLTAATLVGHPAEPLEPGRVAAQIGAALASGRVAAVKLGALGSAAIARAVVDALGPGGVPVIADPSFAAQGSESAEAGLVEAWREMVLPRASVITPNLAEAALLTGTVRAVTRGEMVAQAEALAAHGAAHAIVSGGHGQSETSTDIIASRDRPTLEMRAERLERGAMRGLSTTFAAAIAAHVAHDIAPFESVQMAKLFVGSAIAEAERDADGALLFPHQLARLWRRAGEERGA